MRWCPPNKKEREKTRREPRDKKACLHVRRLVLLVPWLRCSSAALVCFLILTPRHIAHTQVRDITRVNRGVETANFLRRANNLDKNRCFSLHGKDRTLDLEAISAEVQEDWVEAFLVYIDSVRRRR